MSRTVPVWDPWGSARRWPSAADGHGRQSAQRAVKAPVGPDRVQQQVITHRHSAPAGRCTRGRQRAGSAPLPRAPGQRPQRRARSEESVDGCMLLQSSDSHCRSWLYGTRSSASHPPVRPVSPDSGELVMLPRVTLPSPRHLCVTQKHLPQSTSKRQGLKDTPYRSYYQPREQRNDPAATPSPAGHSTICQEPQHHQSHILHHQVHNDRSARLTSPLQAAAGGTRALCQSCRDTSLSSHTALWWLSCCTRRGQSSVQGTSP